MNIKEVMGYWISCSFDLDVAFLLFAYMTEKLIKGAGEALF